MLHPGFDEIARVLIILNNSTDFYRMIGPGVKVFTIHIMEMLHENGLRKVRNSEESRVFLITTVTKCRKMVFDDLFAARIVIDTLRDQQDRKNAETLAFVLMPDHLHWLIQLENGKQLSDIVSAVKSVSAQRINKKIWQNGYHDHALCGMQDIQHMAKYIIENPLRAGLVQNVGDYPHWDANCL